MIFLNQCNILDLYEKRNTTLEIQDLRETDGWMDVIMYRAVNSENHVVILIHLDIDRKAKARITKWQRYI